MSRGALNAEPSKTLPGTQCISDLTVLARWVVCWLTVFILIKSHEHSLTQELSENVASLSLVISILFDCWTMTSFNHLVLTGELRDESYAYPLVAGIIEILRCPGEYLLYVKAS